jgi:hypothetical protein
MNAVEWIKSTFAQRKAHVEVLLESLEHRDAEIRFTNARRMFYVLQGRIQGREFTWMAYMLSAGTFAETISPEHQLHWIFENCKVVRSANGVSTIVEAMKIASSKHDLLWYLSLLILSYYFTDVFVATCSSLSDADAEHFHISATEKADFVEEVTTEISVYLGMLYHLIEVFKGHDDFADELSKQPLSKNDLRLYISCSESRSSSTGLSVQRSFWATRQKCKRLPDQEGLLTITFRVCFGVYYILQLLLVLWKTLLTCCGGIRDLVRVKKLGRELAGLPPIIEQCHYPVKPHMCRSV